MFTIRLYYVTGDSFHTEETSSLLGAAWNDLEKAKKALAYIREHREFVENKGSIYTKTSQKKFMRAAHKFPWCAPQAKEPFDVEYQLQVELDDGSMQVIHAFWMGHFEHLQRAEVVIEEDNTTKFETEGY